MIDYCADVVAVEPVFPSAYKAIQLSFAILSSPASTKCPLLTLQQRVADGYIEFVSTSGVDFGELTPLEKRGECASVIHLAASTLDEMEYQALVARFASDYEQTKAVSYMVPYIEDCLTGRAKAAAKHITWRLYCRGKDEHKLSSYKIAGEAGGMSADTVQRAVEKAGKYLNRVERDAIEKLKPVFTAGGISRY